MFLTSGLAFAQDAATTAPEATMETTTEAKTETKPEKKVEKKAEKKAAAPAKYSDVKALKIDEVKKGKGVEAKAGKTVVVHYTGWLTNGSKFDSSVDRGEPFSFNLGTGQVIPGWDKGVAGMKKGGKRKLHIPPDMGYGKDGSPPVIPPNATLIFDVELLDVKG